jgi:hypothetical protein
MGPAGDSIGNEIDGRRPPGRPCMEDDNVGILVKRRATLAAVIASAAVAIGAPAAIATPTSVRVGGLPPSVTCPPWYGLYSIAGLGCLSWYQVWLMEHHAYPFGWTTHVTP